MNKLLLRLVSILLVPILIGEPVLADLGPRPAVSSAILQSRSSMVFTVQAVPAAMLWTLPHHLKPAWEVRKSSKINFLSSPAGSVLIWPVLFGTALALAYASPGSNVHTVAFNAGTVASVLVLAAVMTDDATPPGGAFGVLKPSKSTLSLRQIAENLVKQRSSAWFKQHQNEKAEIPETAIAPLQAAAKQAETRRPSDAETLDALRWITKIAFRVNAFANLDIRDLIQVGFVGFMDAYQRFDPARDVTLETFAEYRVGGAMWDYFRRNVSPARKSRHQALEINKAAGDLEKSLGRSPEDSEIAAALHLDLKTYMKRKQTLRRLLSLRILEGTLPNFSPAGDISRDLGDWLSSTPEVLDPYEQALANEQATRLWTALLRLDERLRWVLWLYYFGDLTMSHMIPILGVNNARIQQLHALAMGSLKTANSLPSVSPAARLGLDAARSRFERKAQLALAAFLAASREGSARRRVSGALGQIVRTYAKVTPGGFEYLDYDERAHQAALQELLGPDATPEEYVKFGRLGTTALLLAVALTLLRHHAHDPVLAAFAPLFLTAPAMAWVREAWQRLRNRLIDFPAKLHSLLLFLALPLMAPAPARVLSFLRSPWGAVVIWPVLLGTSILLFNVLPPATAATWTLGAGAGAGGLALTAGMMEGAAPPSATPLPAILKPEEVAEILTTAVNTDVSAGVMLYLLKAQADNPAWTERQRQIIRLILTEDIALLPVYGDFVYDRASNQAIILLGSNRAGKSFLAAMLSGAVPQTPPTGWEFGGSDGLFVIRYAGKSYISRTAKEKGQLTYRAQHRRKHIDTKRDPAIQANGLPVLARVSHVWLLNNPEIEPHRPPESLAMYTTDFSRAQLLWAEWERSGLVEEIPFISATRVDTFRALAQRLMSERSHQEPPAPAADEVNPSAPNISFNPGKLIMLLPFLIPAAALALWAMNYFHPGALTSVWADAHPGVSMTLLASVLLPSALPPYAYRVMRNVYAVPRKLLPVNIEYWLAHNKSTSSTRLQKDARRMPFSGEVTFGKRALPKKILREYWHRKNLDRSMPNRLLEYLLTLYSRHHLVLIDVKDFWRTAHSEGVIDTLSHEKRHRAYRRLMPDQQEDFKKLWSLLKSVSRRPLPADFRENFQFLKMGDYSDAECPEELAVLLSGKSFSKWRFKQDLLNLPVKWAEIKNLSPDLLTDYLDRMHHQGILDIQERLEILRTARQVQKDRKPRSTLKRLTVVAVLILAGSWVLSAPGFALSGLALAPLAAIFSFPGRPRLSPIKDDSILAEPAARLFRAA